MVFVNSDKGKDAFRYLDPPTRLAFVQDPGLVQELDGSASDVQKVRIAAHDVTDMHWLVKHKPVDRNRDHASTCTLTGDNATNDVHLPHQPAAKNISGWIGVTRNGKRPKRQFTFWFIVIGFNCVSNDNLPKYLYIW